MWDFLFDARKIIEKCEIDLKDSKTVNHAIIQIIKKEFEEIIHFIEETGKVPVLNKRRSLYSTYIIVDSADLSSNRELFDLVYEFEENVKRLKKCFILIK